MLLNALPSAKTDDKWLRTYIYMDLAFILNSYSSQYQSTFILFLLHFYHHLVSVFHFQYLSIRLFMIFLAYGD